MKLNELQAKIRESATKFREADTDEEQEAAAVELEQLADAEVEPETAPAEGAATVEALQESQPALVAAIREAAVRDAGKNEGELREQLRESQGLSQRLLAGLEAVNLLREAEVPVEGYAWFLAEIESRNLRESEPIKAFITRTVERDQRNAEKVRESLGVEGNPSRLPGGSPSSDGGFALLREAGIPTKEQVAA